MIIDIWKPIAKKLDGEKCILYKYDICSFNEKKPSYKVRYTCDNCDSNDIHSTDIKTLLKSSWNNINKQMCRKCRSRKSEYEIKKTQIKWVDILESFNKKGYHIKTNSIEYDSANNKSQFILNSKCISI
jgi:hypothetical protein